MRGAWLALAVAAGFGLAWWRLAPRAGPAAVGADSAAVLDGDTALGEALARVNRGQRTLSLPFFERALEAGTSRHPEVAGLYSAVLQDIALDPAMRSSFERTRIMVHALDRLASVAEHTLDPVSRSSLHFQRAYALRVFGFPVDALVELNLAGRLNPDEALISQNQVALAARLAEPENPAR